VQAGEHLFTQSCQYKPLDAGARGLRMPALSYMTRTTRNRSGYG
jgi:hypothetical protein